MLGKKNLGFGVYGVERVLFSSTLLPLNIFLSTIFLNHVKAQKLVSFVMIYSWGTDEIFERIKSCQYENYSIILKFRIISK